MDTTLFTLRLKEAREKEGLSLKELQARVGISLSALNNYVAGKTVPPLDVAVRLAKELHVSLDWLSGIDSENVIPVVDIRDCYGAICALDQIVEMFETASIEPTGSDCSESNDGHSENEGVTLHVVSGVLHEYYTNRQQLMSLREALPMELLVRYGAQLLTLQDSYRESVNKSKAPTGLKEE